MAVAGIAEDEDAHAERSRLSELDRHHLPVRRRRDERKAGRHDR